MNTHSQATANLVIPCSAEDYSLFSLLWGTVKQRYENHKEEYDDDLALEIAPYESHKGLYFYADCEVNFDVIHLPDYAPVLRSIGVLITRAGCDDLVITSVTWGDRPIPATCYGWKLTIDKAGETKIE